MAEADQLERFHVAIAAFEIRFEQDLSEPWEKLQTEAYFAITGCSPGEKWRPFHRFFEDVGVEVSRVIHSYFPSLLQLAAANRQFLGEQLPIAWTKSQILRQVCGFLRFDEEFDEAVSPGPDSRILLSAESFTAGAERLDRGQVGVAFLLPKWTRVPHPIYDLFPSTDARARYEAELETEELSRAETLEWATAREFWLRKSVERQIEKEELDGLIEAAKSTVHTWNPSDVDNVASKENLPGANAGSQTNRFVWEGVGWTITFREETCKLPPTIGLDYISVLLQHAGQELTALQVQALATGSGNGAHLVLADTDKKPSHDPDAATQRGEFLRDEPIDGTTIRQTKVRMRTLEREIAERQERGDFNLAELQEEHAHIQAYLKASLNLRHRPRPFADENEKARQSITQAQRPSSPRRQRTVRFSQLKVGDGC